MIREKIARAFALCAMLLCAGCASSELEQKIEELRASNEKMGERVGSLESRMAEQGASGDAKIQTNAEAIKHLVAIAKNNAGIQDEHSKLMENLSRESREADIQVREEFQSANVSLKKDLDTQSQELRAEIGTVHKVASRSRTESLKSVRDSLDAAARSIERDIQRLPSPAPSRTE